MRTACRVRGPQAPRRLAQRRAPGPALPLRAPPPPLPAPPPSLPAPPSWLGLPKAPAPQGPLSGLAASNPCGSHAPNRVLQQSPDPTLLLSTSLSVSTHTL